MFLASTEKSPVPGRRWSAKVIYLVSHSGRTLLPQTQGRRHVSQHLIHVRVRHAAPGSTENKNGSGDRESKEGRVEGGEDTEEKTKKKKPKPKPQEPKKYRKKDVENNKIGISNK